MRSVIGSLFCIAALHAGIANAAGFDCGKASTLIEHMICDNETVSSLDSDLNKAYKNALAGATDKKGVEIDQRQWIVGVRNKCPDATCLQQEYTKRISQLTNTGVNQAAVSPASSTTPQASAVASPSPAPAASAPAPQPTQAASPVQVKTPSVGQAPSPSASAPTQAAPKKDDEMPSWFVGAFWGGLIVLIFGGRKLLKWMKKRKANKPKPKPVIKQAKNEEQVGEEDEIVEPEHPEKSMKDKAIDIALFILIIWSSVHFLKIVFHGSSSGTQAISLISSPLEDAAMSLLTKSDHSIAQEGAGNCDSVENATLKNVTTGTISSSPETGRLNNPIPALMAQYDFVCVNRTLGQRDRKTIQWIVLGYDESFQVFRCVAIGGKPYVDEQAGYCGFVAK